MYTFADYYDPYGVDPPPPPLVPRPNPSIDFAAGQEYLRQQIARQNRSPTQPVIVGSPGGPQRVPYSHEWGGYRPTSPQESLAMQRWREKMRSESVARQQQASAVSASPAEPPSAPGVDQPSAAEPQSPEKLDWSPPVTDSRSKTGVSTGMAIHPFDMASRIQNQQANILTQMGDDVEEALANENASRVRQAREARMLQQEAELERMRQEAALRRIQMENASRERVAQIQSRTQRALAGLPITRTLRNGQWIES